MKPKQPKPHLFHRLISQYRHLLTIQNAGLAVALLVALSWIWGAVVTLQKNYQPQQQVDANNQSIAVTKLQNQNLQFQQAYLKSDEFLELSARQKLGLAQPGERLVMLPSSEGITDKVTTDQPAATPDEQDNFTRWLQFFFGE